MTTYIPMLTISIIISLILFIYILKNKLKNQLNQIFAINIALVIILTFSVLCQLLFAEKFNIDPIRFEFCSYIGGCLLPVSVFLTGLIYTNTSIAFKKRYLLLFIIPITSLIILWTNDYHNLFYEHYSPDFQENVYGPYATIHTIYSYILLILGILYILKFSIKNSGAFSKQSTLIVLGISFPVIINILGTLQIIPMTIYITPITFTLTILCFAISIFKFQFLGVAPIALQKIVNKISDSYVVLGTSNNITDFNQTFVNTFKLKKQNIRSKNFIDLLEKNGTNKNITRSIEKNIEYCNKTQATVSLEQKFDLINKYFQIEITPISSDGRSLGTLFLLKDITQHKEDMKTIQNNQEILMERERLASLGQLIGGIAHNLKTPIMSISGAAEGLSDLVNEFDLSIGNPVVTNNDFHDIAKDMNEWVKKIKSYTEYMSDVLTAVKGQAVVLSEDEEMNFTIGELFKRVDILMKHELNTSLTYLNTFITISESTVINGNVNILVQVINNMISNSIQAYNGKTDRSIDLIASQNKNNVIITVRDYGPGLSEKVKDKLFKEMITTKGKNGTGLGLYMSYSTIKAHFHGDIKVKSEPNYGTTFNIILPL